MFLSKILLIVGTIAAISVPKLASNESGIEPAYNYENIINPDNYLTSQGTTISAEEEGLTFNGTISYLLGFNFEQNTDHKIKLKFNIDEIGDVGEAWVVFHDNPNDLLGSASEDIPGYYIRLKNNHYTSWSFDAFYTDGINYKAEMLGTEITTKGDIRRDHTIQFETSLIQGYTDGVRCFYHGVHYGDWLGYSRVKNRTLTNDSNEIFISMGGAKMTITNIVSSDITAPKITYTPPEQEVGYCNEEYVFGDISIFDEIDGEVPFTYKVLDSQNKDITNSVYYNGEEKLCFSPIEAGEYTFRISATDYSYNTASKRIYINIINRPHYPIFVEVPSFSKVARKSQNYYFPVPKAQDITEDEFPKDNDITYEYSGYFLSDSKQKMDINVYQDTNGYYFTPEEYEAYLTDGVGSYTLRIKATNSYGSTFVEKDIWVKYDLCDSEAFKNENITKKANWNYDKLMSFEENRVGIATNTYYKAGLPLEKGIKINFSVDQLEDKSNVDCWFSFALLKHPGQAKYGERKCGLYFMFFYQNGAFRYNLQYVLENGSYIDIKNNEALYSQIPDSIELEITPFDITLDPNMEDNIEGYFDKTKIDSFEIYKVYRSELEDDEQFVYLSFGYYYGGISEGTTFETTTNPRYYINSIINTDKTAPTISLKGDVPSSAKANESITLPEAIGTDETDGEIDASLLSVTRPDNKGITVINKTFTPIYNGIYTVTYIATDSSGNSSTLVKTIDVTGGKDIGKDEPSKKSGCGSSITISSSVIALVSIIGFILIKTKKER